MAGQISDTGAQYSLGFGLIYIFNLIVGTGALAMPIAFHTAGWLLSLILIIILGLFSYLTATFVMESMAVANAVLKTQSRSSEQNDVINSPGRIALIAVYQRDRPYYQAVSRQNRPEERTALLNGHGNPFLITERTELGQMASMFYNKVGEKLFYLCIVIYLYGDLAIYGAAVPKSIRDVACTHRLTPNTTNGTSYCDGNLADSDLCWTSTSLTRADAYRIFVAVFLVCLGPLTFFNVQKTKYLQILTTLTRWTAFVMMIILAIINLSRGKGEGHPVVANFVGVPNLFGVCVYSFMCHHSLPSLITPIKDKSKLFGLMGLDYLIILIFYALLSFTGIYVFNDVKDVYTLNFLPDDCGISKSITDVPFIQYVLALFPVFTLSTNFPIISITLRNNLKTIWYNKNKPYPYFVDKYVFPLLAVLPPAALAFGTDQVGFLVGITGSYAGAAIQYIIPATLVYFARKKATEFDEGNIHSSMFRSRVWIILVIAWAILCIGFVTVNHIITRQ